ncbi:MAG: FRG domain-containing protein [Phycisphaerae bacterium]|nr:FRG domain-containing protein [Phycisphaerae bacterium]
MSRVFVNPTYWHSESQYDLDHAWPAHRVHTIDELLEWLGRMNRQGIAWRGVDGDFVSLVPAVFRRGPVSLEAEHRLVCEFVDQAYDLLTKPERVRVDRSRERWGRSLNFGSIFVAQHREVPTRGLDWTDNPEVALHFAMGCDRSRCEQPGREVRRDAWVWWLNAAELDSRVSGLWQPLGVLPERAPDALERDLGSNFESFGTKRWITALRFDDLENDRPMRQAAWSIYTSASYPHYDRLLHGLGIEKCGRLIIPASLRPKVWAFLEGRGINDKQLGLIPDAAQDVAIKIRRAWEEGRQTLA